MSAQRALIVSSVQGVGWGAEEVLEQYLRARATVQDDAIVVAAPRTSRFPTICRETGHDYLELPAVRDAFLSNLVGALRAKRPRGLTAAYAWGARSIEAALAIAMLWRLPFFLSLRDHPAAAHHGRLRRALIRAAFRRARRLLCSTHSLAEECRGAGYKGEPTVVPNGAMDLPVVRKERAGPPVVGFLGMNSRQKGFDVLRRWIVETRDLDLRWELYGEAHPALQRDLDQLRRQLPDRVSYRGRRPQHEIYPRLDLVAMPATSYEAFGMVALESARAGLPVICSRVGGPEEVIVHGETGWLYPPERADAGCEYLRRLLRDPEEKERMGQAARLRYEQHFTAQQMREGLDAFFLGGKERGAIAAPESTR